MESITRSLSLLGLDSRRPSCGMANEQANVRLHKFRGAAQGKLSSVQKNEMTNEVCRLMAAEMRAG